MNGVNLRAISDVETTANGLEADVTETVINSEERTGEEEEKEEEREEGDEEENAEEEVDFVYIVTPL